MTSSPDAVLDGVSAVLSGGSADLTAFSPGDVLEIANAQGVGPLLAGALELRGGAGEIQTLLRRERALGAALEGLRQREIVRVLSALASSDIHPLLVKGSALAYTVYDDPALRPRFDTDFFVPREFAAPIAEVMTRLGYDRPAQVTGELVMHQVDYLRRDPSGVWHVFDFHWKLSNRQAVADTLRYEEVSAASEPIPVLGPAARGPNHVHALILACVHRIAHHSTDERLIWLFDIHLLASRLQPHEVDQFVDLTRDRSVTLICADGLQAAKRRFATALPAGLLERLRPAGVPPREASAALLTAEPTLARELLSDLKAVSWPDRLRLMKEHAFPSARYMTTTYRSASRAWLPALYTHRLVRGAWRLLRGAAR